MKMDPRALTQSAREIVGPPGPASDFSSGVKELSGGGGGPGAGDTGGATGAGSDSVELVPSIHEIERPVFRTHWRAWRWENAPDERPRPPGLWWHGLKVVNRRTGEIETVDLRVCGPLRVAAITKDETGDAFGLLLSFRDLDGRERTLAVPRAILAGGGAELEKILLNAGLELEPNRGRLLLEYLLKTRPRARVTAVRRTGWTRDASAFVLPGLVIGRNDVVLQTAAPAASMAGGDFASWREAMGALEGNSLAAAMVLAAFAGPLLRLVGRSSAGVHLHGPSSSGKSTALKVAASVWGAPDDIVRSWNATRNGLEAVAAASNDTVLALDEIGEARPDSLQEIVYAIANDTGRTRANREGGLRDLQRWRVVLLSTGEIPLARHLEFARLRPAPGVRVRLLDIFAAGRWGVFDELHGYASGARLAEALGDAVAVHHGHAGPALVQHIFDNGGRERVRTLYERARGLPALSAASGIEGRAAGFFALMVVAGLLAAEVTILPWSAEFIVDAATALFARWRERSAPRDPATEAITRIREFLDRHGADRFAPVDGSRPVRDRAGWYEEDPYGRRIWLFTPLAFREALGDLDERAAAQALAKAGVLVPGERGRLTTKRRIEGRRPRVYVIRFPDDEDADDGE